jgi:UDP-3-O-[3-hydroxymyristoyl] glucosamine N-acyltransferase
MKNQHAGQNPGCKKGQIAFLIQSKYEQFIYTTQASAVIVKNDFVPKKEVSATLILVDDPYISFTLCWRNITS